jgi:hypothetical protein
MTRKPALLFATLALAGAMASGQTVYRCGNSYGTQPCTGGAAFDASDPRTPADAARADQVSAEEAKRADAMEKARLAREKEAPKALVIGPKEAKEPAKAPDDKKKKKKKGKPEDPDVFTAKAPKAPKK